MARSVQHASIPGNIAVVAPIRLKGATRHLLDLPLHLPAGSGHGNGIARSLGHKSNKDETVAKLISFIK